MVVFFNTCQGVQEVRAGGQPDASEQYLDTVASQRQLHGYGYLPSVAIWSSSLHMQVGLALVAAVMVLGIERLEAWLAPWQSAPSQT